MPERFDVQSPKHVRLRAGEQLPHGSNLRDGARRLRQHHPLWLVPLWDHLQQQWHRLRLPARDHLPRWAELRDGTGRLRRHG